MKGVDVARSGINYIDVAKAAEHLKALDVEPTVDKVRERLGTGSKSTIGPLLKQWKAENNDPQTTDGLPGDLVEIVRSLYSRTQDYADAKIEKTEGVLYKEKEALTTQLQAALDKIRIIERDNQTLTRHASQLNETLTQISREKDALEISSAKQETLITQYDVKIAELKDTVSELKNENKDIREHFEHFQLRTNEEKQREREQFKNNQLIEQERNTDLNDELSNVRVSLQQREATLEKQIVTIADLKRAAEEYRFANSNAATMIAALREEKLVATKKATLLAENFEKSLEDIRQLSFDLKIANNKNNALEDDLAEVKKKLNSALLKQEELKDKLHLISNEKSVIQGQFIQLQKSL